MDDSRKFLSVGEIRRAYFSPKSRPSRKTVENWIKSGTTEGATLRGVCIDGDYFARRSDVEAFLSILLVEPEHAKAPARREGDKAARVENALSACRRHGLKC